MEKIKEYLKNMKRIHLAILLTLFGIILAIIVCYLLATFSPYSKIPNGNEFIILKPYLDIGPAIALLVGLLAFIISIFTNFYTSEKNKENIVENLTLPKKEEAIFTVKQCIDNIVLSNDSKSTTISLPNVLYEELKKENANLDSIFKPNDRSRFFSYFKKVSRNNPMIFYYLNNKTQEKIHRYINKYDDIIFDIRDIVYYCEVHVGEVITTIESKFGDIEEILDIKKSSIDINKKSKLYITLHSDDYQGHEFYHRWNFILKDFYYETLLSRKSELTDVAANIRQDMVDELNQILKDIFLEIDDEYKKFGYPE